MLAWKRIGVFVILLIWIFTFIIGRNFEDRSLYFMAPKPYYYDYSKEVNKRHNFTSPKYKNASKLIEGRKTILFYTPYFHMIDFQFGFGQQPFIDYGCPVTNCYTTNEQILGKTCI